MKVSLNWIKDYVDLPADMDLKRLAYDLTMSTVEVEDTIEPVSYTHLDFVDNRPHAVIGMVDGEITTTDCGYTDRIDAEYDFLKIAVIERHKNTHHIGLGYIKGYGLKHGAVATSISHDSHNIIVVGANDEDMAFAANQVVALNGGIVVAQNGAVTGEVPLAVAGIMSDEPLVEVNRKLEEAKEKEMCIRDRVHTTRAQRR